MRGINRLRLSTMSSTPGRFRRRALAAMTTITTVLGGVMVVPSGPAFADPVEAPCDRQKVMLAWHAAGKYARAAAQTALVGGNADLCAFLENGRADALRADERAAVEELLPTAGPAVRAAARQALDAGDPAAIRTFLTTGWRQPSEADQRVRLAQLMASGGPLLKSAGQKALDGLDPAAVETFLETGWRAPWETDQRMRVAQLMAGGGPQVRTMASRALAAGTTDAYARFIDVEWPVAAARDQETATLTDLVSQATAAGALATQETRLAIDEADKAVAAADKARLAAQTAMEAGARAQGNADAAEAAAALAAAAADNAASAARQAVASAKAAADAARAAAGAAARASSAAAKAGQAAAEAQRSAGAAWSDETKAEEARMAAVRARGLAENARATSDQALVAAYAVDRANAAIDAAESAKGHAEAAAASTIKAADYAMSAGRDGSKARAAAQRAAANAARAGRMVVAARIFSTIAAAAATASAEAARRAADDARTAAAAADEAAAHAGEAAGAADRAEAHAAAALAAADAAQTAATQAKTVYDAARAADKVRLAVQVEEGREAAAEANRQADAQHRRIAWDAQEAEKRSAETNALLAETANPATPRATAVSAGRRAALALSSTSGEWTKAAAERALGGPDDGVLEFARSGVAFAAAQDDRVRLMQVGTSGSEALEQAADHVLDTGTDADVAAFLRDPAYPERATEDRITVSQLLAEANETGGVTTAREAQRALDGTPAMLRAFIEEGQHAARLVDDRIRAGRILADPASGPETKAATQVALDSPAGTLRRFLTVDINAARQRDADGAAHEAVVLSLLAQAEQAGQTAKRHAAYAQEAAAFARGASDAAQRYAQEARDAATAAAAAAERSANAAADAQLSATAAATSEKTAQAAARKAGVSSRQAAHSAMWATVSARQAADQAQEAYDAYEEAKASATNAGASAADAAQAGETARAAAMERIKQDRLKQWVVDTRLCANPINQLSVDYETCMKRANAVLGGALGVPKYEQELAKIALVNGEFCGLYTVAGSDLQKSCLYEVYSPTFEGNRITDMVTPAIALLQFVSTMSAIGMGIALGITTVPMLWSVCGAICAGALEAAGPLLSPELIGVPIAGYAPYIGSVAGTFATIRAATSMEKIILRFKLEETALARWADELLTRCVNSFTPQTPILLADGGRRPIKDIRVGDRVLASDPTTAATIAEPVTHIISSTGTKHLVDISVDTGDGTGSITATGEHRFWVTSLSRWVAAKNLRTGQTLRTSNGTSARVSTVEQRVARTGAYNLTVADLHTYYVIADSTPVLVHNEEPCRTLALGVRDGKLSKLAGDKNFKTYLDPRYEDTWRRLVREDIENPNVPIAVSLDRFDGPSNDWLGQFMLAVKGGLGAGKKATQEEMRWLVDAVLGYNRINPDGTVTYVKRDWNSIEFYNGEGKTGERVTIDPPNWISPNIVPVSDGKDWTGSEGLPLFYICKWYLRLDKCADFRDIYDPWPPQAS